MVTALQARVEPVERLFEELRERRGRRWQTGFWRTWGSWRGIGKGVEGVLGRQGKGQTMCVDMDG
jgi:hypothetical protein